MALLDRTIALPPAPARAAVVPARPALPARVMAGALSARLGNAAGAAHLRQLALATTVLWTEFLKSDAADPHWPDRDRVLFSAEATPLALAVRALTGESDAEQGTPPSLAPPGQALAIGVGLAVAERLLAARFGKSLVDHRTWVIAAEADLMGGIGHEAAGFAGQLKLGRLALLWAEPDPVAAALRRHDVAKRFAAYGWAVKRADAGDPATVAAALSFALRSRKPTLIACAAEGENPELPTRGAAVHGVADWRRTCWEAAGARGNGVRRGWLKRAARHPMRAEFARVMAGRLPAAVVDALGRQKAELRARGALLAPRLAGERLLASLMPLLPELVTGSAPESEAAAIAAGNFRGRHLGRAIREGGLAAALNGIAMHGGLIPCAATALAYSDAIRPALRFAAASRQRIIHVVEHDGAGSAAGVAPHRPAGHLASLRAVPNLHVYRPADAIETAECWELALGRAEGPSLLVLTREPGAVLRTGSERNLCARGGYVLAEAEGPRQATLIASGGEVAVAAAARRLLADQGTAVAVVSLPCWELFEEQPETYRAHVLGAAPRVGIEAALGFGWERWLGDDGWFAGAREPGGETAALTGEAVAASLKRLLRRDGAEETTSDVQKNRD